MQANAQQSEQPLLEAEALLRTLEEAWNAGVSAEAPVYDAVECA
jgi:hypothetical protein